MAVVRALHEGACRIARGLVAEGFLRINRQPTDKAHARLRVGDVLTVPLRGEVRVVRVAALAALRKSAAEAQRLYQEIAQPAIVASSDASYVASSVASAAAATALGARPPCAGPESSAYAAEDDGP